MPLIVIVFEAHAAVTPAGSPLALPMPVAPVVVCVMAVSAILIDKVGVEDATPTVLSGVTVTMLVSLSAVVQIGLVVPTLTRVRVVFDVAPFTVMV